MHTWLLVFLVGWLVWLLAWLLGLWVMLVSGKFSAFFCKMPDKAGAQCAVAIAQFDGLSAGCRANAQQPKLFVGMILILIFAEALALYGLIGKPSVCTHLLKANVYKLHDIY